MAHSANFKKRNEKKKKLTHDQKSNVVGKHALVQATEVCDEKKNTHERNDVDICWEQNTLTYVELPELFVEFPFAWSATIDGVEIDFWSREPPPNAETGER